MSKTPDSPISLREINRDNFNAVVNLNVRDDQKNFVASNVYSIAESKVYPENTPLAVYAGEVPVGFLMYGFWDERSWYVIIRMMIAAEHQGKGYGREAMRQVIERIRVLPGCQEIYISYEPENLGAKTLYASLGFFPTGEILEGEEVACLKLADMIPGG